MSRFTGSRRSTRRGVGTDYTDFREFVQGDDPRQLDWALFGRTDRLFVKLYEEEGDLTLHLLVDLSRSMRCGDGPGVRPGAPESKLGRALRCAAAAAHIALAGLDRVQIHLFDRAIFRSSRVCRGPSAFSHLLGFLSLQGGRAVPHGEGTDLAAVAKAFCNNTPGTGLCLLISDLFDPEWRRGLSILRQRRHELHLLQICGDDERLDWEPGEFDLEDSETGASRAVRLDRAALEAQRRRISAFREEAAAFCAANGIGCARFDPGEPFDEAVFRVLSQSGIAAWK